MVSKQLFLKSSRTADAKTILISHSRAIKRSPKTYIHKVPLELLEF